MDEVLDAAEIEGMGTTGLGPSASISEGSLSSAPPMSSKRLVRAPSPVPEERQLSLSATFEIKR